jgi:hypothetical protein
VSLHTPSASNKAPALRSLAPLYNIVSFACFNCPPPGSLSATGPLLIRNNRWMTFLIGLQFMAAAHALMSVFDQWHPLLRRVGAFAPLRPCAACSGALELGPAGGADHSFPLFMWTSLAAPQRSTVLRSCAQYVTLPRDAAPVRSIW